METRLHINKGVNSNHYAYFNQEKMYGVFMLKIKDGLV